MVPTPLPVLVGAGQQMGWPIVTQQLVRRRIAADQQAFICCREILEFLAHCPAGGAEHRGDRRIRHECREETDYAGLSWVVHERRLGAQREAETWQRERRDVVEVPGLTQAVRPC